MSKLKISGVRNFKDIGLVNELSPEYVGLVFYEDNHRITANIASKLVFGLRPEIDTIGMFKNHEISEITSLLVAGLVDMVELCGDENEQFVEKLKLRVEAKIIKHFELKTQAQALAVNDSKADIASLCIEDVKRRRELADLITKPIILRCDGNIGDIKSCCEGLNIFAVDSDAVFDDKGELSRQDVSKLMNEIN